MHCSRDEILMKKMSCVVNCINYDIFEKIGGYNILVSWNSSVVPKRSHRLAGAKFMIVFQRCRVRLLRVSPRAAYVMLVHIFIGKLLMNTFVTCEYQFLNKMAQHVLHSLIHWAIKLCDEILKKTDIELVFLFVFVKFFRVIYSLPKLLFTYYRRAIFSCQMIIKNDIYFFTSNACWINLFLNGDF